MSSGAVESRGNRRQSVLESYNRVPYMYHIYNNINEIPETGEQLFETCFFL